MCEYPTAKPSTLLAEVKHKPKGSYQEGMDILILMDTGIFGLCNSWKEKTVNDRKQQDRSGKIRTSQDR